ncbi:hypothetical protein [Thalassospira sp.]|uniref:hypothetical protein n=1 Tax=Thalassospira sp. TaxID=1912094 RepID=UPI000C40B1B2|nr:hypothetical protein [Thalassospira sp.]MBC05312.1 hypothetical protein [Thalassospira sp.]
MSLISSLAGCSLPGAGVDVGGDLKLLYAPFSLSNPPRYWQVRQNGDPGPLSWEDKDGRIALAARPGLGSFEIGRRTNVIVLASPFLSFDWQFNSAAQVGDVELVLGFRRQAQGSWTENDLGSGKPGIDHEVRIAIGQYSVRYGEWHREYFDLATLYRRYWPDAPADEVRLVWIGLVSGTDHAPVENSVTHLTHILLSR